MKTTLRGITWQNPRGYDPLVAASEIWMQSHPEVHVVWEQLPWYRFEEAVLGSLARGDGTYDLIMFDHPWTGKLASEGWLIPWEELVAPSDLEALTARVVAPSTESYCLDGHQWALPLDAACHAGLYRRDLCDVADLPMEWESVKDWALARHRPGEFYPLVLSLEGVLGTCLFLSLMAGVGAPAFHDAAHPACDKAAARKVLGLLKELIAFTPPGSTHWGPWDIYDAMSQRDDIAFSPSIFAYVNYFTSAPRQREFRLCRVPGFAGGRVGRPILGGVGVGVARASGNPVLAGSLGWFLMGETVQKDIFPTHSGQPATRASWADPEINRERHGFYTALAENMRTAYTRPRYPAFHALELEVGRLLQFFWDDEASLDQTLSRICKL